MKRDQRRVYVALANEINCQPCLFCRYANFVSEGCCDGYSECSHPLYYRFGYEFVPEPCDDCWGFRPCCPIDVCADIAGAIISQNYDEWGVKSYSRTAVTVYGRDSDGNGSKVRIGHNGKELNS